MLEAGLLAMVVTLAIVAPHAIPLWRADAPGAIAVWCASLGLRALVGVFFVIWLLLFLPASQLFSALTHWCWHTVVPMLTTHLGLDGYLVGSTAVSIPGFLLVVSVLSVGVGLWRVARAVRRLVSSSAVGRGPDGAIIVGGSGVLVAAAGIGRPRVVVSAGALTSFDDEELAAALDHERGHIARRHRFILLYAEICGALGRFIPGTRRAVRELAFHLERDADRWALRSHDRFALASAIMKAAASRQPPCGPVAIGLAGAGHLETRLGALVHGDVPSPRARRGLRLVGGMSVALAAALAMSVPATVAAGVQLQAVPAAHDCPS